MKGKQSWEEGGKTFLREAIQKQLYRLGVNWSYCGFGQSLGSALMLAQNEDIGSCMKAVYIEVAAKSHTSKENVERDIRTLIQTIWRYGDRNALEELAGRKLKKPPTSREFIWMLADCVKRREGPA